jgi:hypothetical protein
MYIVRISRIRLAKSHPPVDVFPQFRTVYMTGLPGLHCRNTVGQNAGGTNQPNTSSEAPNACLLPRALLIIRVRKIVQSFARPLFTCLVLKRLSEASISISN